MFSLDGYKAVSATGGVVRRQDRGVLALGGVDRAAWLQGLLTNDVENLREGETRYAAYLTPQGRMITDMNVIAQGDRLLLDVPASLAASLRDRLDGLIFSEDVQVTDDTATLGVWTVIRKDSLDAGERITPVPGRLSASFSVTRSERENLPDSICRNTSTIRGILMTLIVSIGVLALMQSSPPSARNLM